MKVVVSTGPVTDFGEGIVGQDVLCLWVDQTDSILVDGNEKNFGELRLCLLLDFKEG